MSEPVTAIAMPLNARLQVRFRACFAAFVPRLVCYRDVALHQRTIVEAALQTRLLRSCRAALYGCAARWKQSFHIPLRERSGPSLRSLLPRRSSVKSAADSSVGSRHVRVPSDVGYAAIEWLLFTSYKAL